jgi:hypothetical protein
MSNDIRDVLKQLIADGYSHSAISMQLYLLQNAGDTNIFETGSVAASDLPEAEPLKRLWRFCLYPGAVSLFVGEWGAGKSSILYNMLIHAAINQPLWDVPFEAARPLRILYIDRENSGQKRLQKLSRLGMGKPKHLLFHDGQNLNLSDPEQMLMLIAFIADKEIDLLVLDPIIACFDTKSENDNAEAQKQMNSLITLAQTTGCSVLCVHHTDKANQGVGGRGATARIAAADVSYLIRTRSLREDGEQDDTFNGETIPREDIVRLQVVKNRYEGVGSLYLQMIGDDKFARSSYPAWRDSDKKEDGSKFEAAQEDIVAILGNGQWKSRAEIFASMAQEGYSQAVTDSALKSLTLTGVLSTQKISQVQRFILSAYLGIEPGGTGDYEPGWS